MFNHTKIILFFLVIRKQLFWTLLVVMNKCYTKRFLKLDSALWNTEKGCVSCMNTCMYFFVFDKRQRKVDTKFFYIWKLFFSLARFLFHLADVISILLSKMDSIFAPRFILWHQNAEEKVWICIFEMKGYIFRSARRGVGTYALKVNYIFSAKCWTNNLHYFVKQELF